MKHPPLPQQIKEARTKSEFTQKKLAELIGVERMVISHYETGFRKPSVDVLEKMAKELKTVFYIE